MIINFHKDLEKGKEAELLVAQLLSVLNYSVRVVSDCKEYRYKGDLLITLPSGEEVFIEVKDDSRIAHTHNILCEEMVFYNDVGRFDKGNM